MYNCIWSEIDILYGIISGHFVVIVILYFNIFKKKMYAEITYHNKLISDIIYDINAR